MQAASVVTSSVGVNVNGTGGKSSTGSSNFGIFIAGEVSGTDSAAVSLNGVGGTGSGGIHHAVYLTGKVSTVSGPLNITGNAINSAGSASFGFHNATSAVTSTTNSPITITSDDMTINGVLSAGTGTVTLQNLTAGTPINLGGLGMAAGIKTLGLDNGEFNRITAGNVILGRNDGLASGAVVVSTPISITSGANFIIKTGSSIGINNALTIGSSGSKNLMLEAGGAVTQTAAINARGLQLRGVGSFTLTNPLNSVSTLASGVGVGAIRFVDSNALTIGSVTSVVTDSGLNSTGTISVGTATGALTVAGNVSTTNASSAAIVLNSGVNLAAGVTTVGSDMVISGSPVVTTGIGGRTVLYSGTVAGTTGIQTLVAAGSGNFRYKSDESISNFTSALGSSGIYAVYRESPTVTPTIGSVNKTYDATAFNGGTLTTAAGAANGDTFAQLTANGTWTGSAQNAKNAGSYVISLSASNALGYTFDPTVAGTLTINAKPITINGLSALNKAYNQNNIAGLSGVASFGTGATNATDNLVYSSDSSVAVSSPTLGTFSQNNVGSGLAVTYSTTGMLTGSGSANYVVVPTNSNLTANITAKSITLSNLTSLNKVYDTTNAATLSGIAMVTSGASNSTDNKVFSGDAVTVIAGPTTGTFSQSNVGSNLAVTYNTTGVVLGGASASNYIVTGASVGAAHITAKPVTVNGLTAVHKVYDTNAFATINGTGSLIGGATNATDNKVYLEDLSSVSVVSPTSGTFIQSNVGVGLAVSFNAAVLTGAKASNYTVVPLQSNLAANITPKELTVKASDIAMVYGDLRPLLPVTATGFSGSETATSTGFNGSATSTGVHAGTHAITPTASALQNYTFSYVPGTLTINKANLTVAIPDYAKLLSEADPNFVIQPTQYSGFKNGDTVTTAGGLVAPTVSRVAGEQVGGYALTATGVSANDYNIIKSYSSSGYQTLSSGGITPICAVTTCSAFIVAGADKLLVTFGNSTGVYGIDPTTVKHNVVNGRYLDSRSNTIQILTQTTSGAANNNIKLTDTSGNYVTFTTAANAVFNSGVGTYTVDVKSGSLDISNSIGTFNTFVSTAGIYTVTPKAITATVNNITKTYDASQFSANGAAVTYNTPLVGTDNLGATIVGGTAVGARNVGSYTLSLQGFTNQSALKNYTITSVAGTLTVDPAILRLNAVTDSRAYNATTSSNGIVEVVGLKGSTDLISNLSQAYQTKNVLGTNASTLMVGNGFVINDGNGGNNYSVITNSAAGTINPASLSLSNLNGVNRVYDTTSKASMTGAATLSGVLLSDNVGLVGAPTTGSFTNKNVGVGKSIVADLAGLSLSGGDAANYNLTNITTARANVTPFQVAIGGLSGATRVYDATSVITLNGTATVAALSTDQLTISGVSPVTGTLNNKNVGQSKSITVSPTALTLGGTDSANYAIDQGLTTATGTVTPLQVILGGLNGNSRVYDGTTLIGVSGAAQSTNTFTGDNLTIVGVVNAGNLATKNVGTNQSLVSVVTSGLALGGIDAANYSVSQGKTTALATVSPLELTLGGLTGGTKIYDGTTSINLTGIATASNAIAGDDVKVSGNITNGVLSNKNVGTGKSIALTSNAGLVLSGTDARNYSIVSGSTTATGTVTARALFIDGLTAGAKGYDGNTTAALNGTARITTTGVDNTVVGGDQVTLSPRGTVSGFYSDRNAEMVKSVTLDSSTLSLSGVDASNYVISTNLHTNGRINKREITITGLIAADRVYDGTSTTALNGNAGLNNTVTGDNVSLTGLTTSSGIFANKNVGTAKSVRIDTAQVVLAGSDARNYVLNTDVNLIANVTPAILKLSGVQFNDKTYDGSTSTPMIGTPSLSGIVAGDNVTYSLPVTSGQFLSKNAGSNIPIAVTLTGATLAGADSGKYLIDSSPKGYAANINRAKIFANATAENKILDFTNTAIVSGVTLSGMVNGELLGTIDNKSIKGTFSQKTPGRDLKVAITGIELSNGPNAELASNYELVNSNATATASIISFKELSPTELVKLVNKLPANKAPADGTTTNLSAKADRPAYLAEMDKPWVKSAATYTLNLDSISDYITVRGAEPRTRTYQDGLIENPTLPK